MTDSVPVWRIIVQLPMSLGDEKYDAIMSAISDVGRDWEPAEGLSVDVTMGHSDQSEYEVGREGGRNQVLQQMGLQDGPWSHPARERTAMSTQPPAGTEQVIRQEAHKTRVLLAWLIGGPIVLVLLAWAVYAIVSSGSGSSSSAQCGSASTTAYIDLAACPLSGPALTEDSSCAEYTADDTQSSDPTKTNPAVYFTNQHTVLDAVQFDTACASNPSESLGQALTQLAGG